MSYEANGKNPADSEINVRPHQAQGFEHPDDVVPNSESDIRRKADRPRVVGLRRLCGGGRTRVEARTWHRPRRQRG